MTEEDRRQGPETAGAGAGAAGPGPESVASRKLVATLGLAGALAGLLIVIVHGWTQPRIEAHKAEVLRLAVHEVLKAPARYDTLYIHAGELVTAPPQGIDARSLEQVYVGYAANGGRVGFAVVGSAPGFQDVIRLIFGYDPGTGEILGMKVLESLETPGLGDKIEKDSSFVTGFEGTEPPLEGVKGGAGAGDPHAVDMITGATISSRTVIEIINARIEEVGPLLEGYVEGAR